MVPKGKLELLAFVSPKVTITITNIEEKRSSSKIQKHIITYFILHMDIIQNINIKMIYINIKKIKGAL